MIFLTYNRGMGKKRGRGRPPKPPDERHEERLELRMQTAEKVAWQAASDRAGKSLAAWMRDKLNRAAKREANRD
jgi:predicted HicB family RNase H-like nuclease